MSVPKDAKLRLAHPHYILNAVLCLPLPVVLGLALYQKADSTSVDYKLTAALLSGPVLLFTQAATSGTSSLEARWENVTWTLRVVNIVGLALLRDYLRYGTITCLLYGLIWLAISFCCPQPPYLGPTRVKSLTSEDFDELIAIRPPAQSLRDAGSIVPLDSDLFLKYERRRAADDSYSIVLFHVDWSRRSRQLEIVVSQLSNQYASARIKFYIATPDTASQTFYDFDLSTAATSLDLPTLMLFHKGNVVGRLPKGAEEIAKARRDARRAARRQRNNDSTPNDDDDLSDDESDDERQVQAEVALERFRWKRTPESIIKAFTLNSIAQGTK